MVRHGPCCTEINGIIRIFNEIKGRLTIKKIDHSLRKKFKSKTEKPSDFLNFCSQNKTQRKV